MQWRKPASLRIGAVTCLLAWSFTLSAKSVKPATPNASPEARALLDLFYAISGKYTLTGQHNYPNTRDRNSQFAAKYIGKTPAIWSTDMGFAKDGDTDSYLARPDIVEEAKRQHRQGSLVTICWHAVPPTADEPVTFRPVPGRASKPESLATVQGRLLDRQFRDILTPGTPLYRRWCGQVDSVARYLKMLRDARVPVLWRPYHEMNGDWFWWGGRHGKYGTAALYRQLFDRLVNHHHLTNLVWIWSVDRPNNPEMNFSHYYPGAKYLDILALDVYGSDFNPAYYDSLSALSGGKPMVLGEVGNPPTLEILAAQPKWAYYVVWAGMVRNTPKKRHLALIADPRILCLEDSAFRAAIAPLRAAGGLPALPPVDRKRRPVRADFTGVWVLNEEKSLLDDTGAGYLPARMEIDQTAALLVAKRITLVEYADDRVTTDSLALDGREMRSEFWNSPRVTTARWSADGDTLIIESKVALRRAGQASEMVTNEFWTLEEGGRLLFIRQLSGAFFGRGPRNITQVYEKR
jgi:mannan endo-1,4-beta-mannosidase